MDGAGTGARRVSIKDVAARAGVSWKTVSNVVNERPVVTPATRERVRAAIDELGYVPNHVARDLRGAATRTIALVLPELANPYFAQLAERVQQAARERGYTVSVELTLGDVEVERDQLRGRTRRPVDAVIISPMMLETAELASLDPPVPVVLLGESVRAGRNLFHVAIDNAASAVDVVRHLVDTGRRRPLFLGAQHGRRSTGTQRFEGFRAAARFAGLEQDEGLVVGAPTWDRATGHEVVARLLAQGARFDAVVAANDLLAIGALRALREAGARVPDDVAVVGWDAIPEGEFCVPPLTTVAPDLDALVSAALDAALGGAAPVPPEAEAHEVRIGHALVVRGSSAAPV
ncbi:LacI family DNA-binding transcriptional regulator [Brachybacterium huguangmaarense]